MYLQVPRLGPTSNAMKRDFHGYFYRSYNYDILIG